MAKEFPNEPRKQARWDLMQAIAAIKSEPAQAEKCAHYSCAVGPNGKPGTRSEHATAKAGMWPKCHDFVAQPAATDALACVNGCNEVTHNTGCAVHSPIPAAPAPRLPKAGETWRYAGFSDVIYRVLSTEPQGLGVDFIGGEKLWWNNGSGWTYVSGAEDAVEVKPQQQMTIMAGRQAGKSRVADAIARIDRRIDTNETGQSAVAAASAREPWRPSVDPDFWIPDATEWRRR